jgi:hypothetical protein
MIRLIIFALGVLLVWVLFSSKFERPQKIIISILIVMFAVLGVWFEQYGETPKESLVEPKQLEVCGVTGQHSYRTNYDIGLCVQNKSKYVIKRLAFSVVVSQCEGEKCRELQKVARERPVQIGRDQRTILTESLDFTLLDPSMKNLEWGVELTSIRAIK